MTRENKTTPEPTPMLDAIKREAWEAGMMEAARLVSAAGLSGGGYAAVIMSALRGPAKQYDHADNVPGDITSYAITRGGLRQ
jgi:hypothetical protein